jgi:hypothetical protein
MDDVIQIRRFRRAGSMAHLVQPGQSPSASDEMESPLFSHILFVIHVSRHGVDRVGK